jgi:phosphate starvation-inducible membrane PsiE
MTTKQEPVKQNNSCYTTGYSTSIDQQSIDNANHNHANQAPILRLLNSIGNFIVDGFHYVALLAIIIIIMYSSFMEYFAILKKGHGSLKDIMLLFIYLEMGAMIGIYFKSHRLPVQFLIFIAITALARHLVVDVQNLSEPIHLYTLIALSGSIILLSASLFALGYSAKRFGRPEDNLINIKNK